MIFFNLKHRRGTSLIELILFLGFFAIASSAVLVLLFGTMEQRKRQEGIAVVDQTAMQLLQTISHRVRAAERIQYPVRGSTGSVLALQMAANADNPTVIALQSGSLIAVERDEFSMLTSTDEVEVTEFQVQVTSAIEDRPSVYVYFTLKKILGIPSQPEYSRSFETLISLFPDDELQGDQCNCDIPVCNVGMLDWQYCNNDVCVDSTERVSCP